MGKKLLKKLKSNRGESISEVLVASLVVAMGFLMVASMISVSYKTIRATDATMKQYYTDHNAFEQGTATESTGTLNVTTIIDSDNTTSVNSTYRNISVYSESVTVGENTKLYVQYEVK